MDGEAELTRRTRFRARHAYRVPGGDEAGSEAAFGALSRPHGHTFSLDVTVRGPMDPATGFVVDLAALDDALEALVGPLRGTLLNESVEALRGGRPLPCTEALARWAWERLVDAVPGSARLHAVRVAEDDDLWAVYRGP